MQGFLRMWGPATGLKGRNDQHWGEMSRGQTVKVAKRPVTLRGIPSFHDYRYGMYR